MVEYPGSGGSSSGSSGGINTGETKTIKTYQTGGGIYDSTIPVFVAPESLADLPQTLWNQGNYQQAQYYAKLAEKAGFTSWQEALNAAAQDPEKNNRSWEDYLIARANDPALQSLLAEQNKGPGGGGSGGGPFRYEDTSISLDSDSSAANMLDQVFEAELGRRASKKEIGAFQKALNQMQQKNPSTTVQEGVTSPKGNSRTSTSTSTKNFDPTRFAQEWARSRPEYAENYAATTFMSVLDRAIAAPNTLGEM